MSELIVDPVTEAVTELSYTPEGVTEIGRQADGTLGIAWYSHDMSYRYCLYRSWDKQEKPCAFIGLNPSTATAIEDDPTIRRCIGFAKRWGCGSFYMLNVFAYRSTDPKKLGTVDDPTGPDNLETVRRVVMEVNGLGGPVVAAWGTNVKQYPAFVVDMLRYWNVGLKVILCLGTTKAGFPRHPLYLKAETPLEVWTW